MTEAPKGIFSKLKNLHLPAIGIGFYRVESSFDTILEGSKPEYVGPFFSKISATPLPERMGQRDYNHVTQIEFHIFKPQGTKKPAKSEFERVR